MEDHAKQLFVLKPAPMPSSCAGPAGRALNGSSVSASWLSAAIASREAGTGCPRSCGGSGDTADPVARCCGYRSSNSRCRGSRRGLLPGRWLTVECDGEANVRAGWLVQVEMRSVDVVIRRPEITVPVIVIDPHFTSRTSVGSPIHVGSPSLVT